MENDHKDSSEDSTSSETKKEALRSKLQKSHLRQKSMMVLAEMKPAQQEETAQDIFAQMRQLREHNEAMGYHDAYNINRNDNMSTSFDTDEIETPGEFDIISPATHTPNKSGMPRHRAHLRKHVHIKSNQSNGVILPETASLKQKLENISSAINNIMHDLHEQNSAELSETILYFQNQLTDIQDQVEDAENDIESNIDVKFIKYHEEIKVNKQKVKRMKKERKEKKKKQQMEKEKEQQNMIELQRLQIEQLTMQTSHPLSRRQSPEPEPTVNMHPHHQNMRGRHHPAQNDSVYFALDSTTNSVSSKSPHKSSQAPRRRSTLQSYGILQQIESEETNEDYDDEEEAYRDAEEMATQYVSYNNQNAPHPHAAHGAYLMQSHAHTVGPGMMRSISPEVISYNEGHQSRQLQHVQTESEMRPMLSDNAIKIIGGVVIVLAGLWIISKYIDSKRDTAPSYMRGRPPPRYKR